MKLTFYIFFLFLLMCISCQNESSDHNNSLPNALLGSWSTLEAKRNGNNTRLLDPFFIHINPDSIFYNLPDTQVFACHYKLDTLHIEHSTIPFFEILRLSDSSLVLTFNYKQSVFSLKMLKKSHILEASKS